MRTHELAHALLERPDNDLTIVVASKTFKTTDHALHPGGVFTTKDGGLAIQTIHPSKRKKANVFAIKEVDGCLHLPPLLANTIGGFTIYLSKLLSLKPSFIPERFNKLLKDEIKCFDNYKIDSKHRQVNGNVFKLPIEHLNYALDIYVGDCVQFDDTTCDRKCTAFQALRRLAFISFIEHITSPNVHYQYFLHAPFSEWFWNLYRHSILDKRSFSVRFGGEIRSLMSNAKPYKVIIGDEYVVDGLNERTFLFKPCDLVSTNSFINTFTVLKKDENAHLLTPFIVYGKVGEIYGGIPLYMMEENDEPS